MRYRTLNILHKMTQDKFALKLSTQVFILCATLVVLQIHHGTNLVYLRTSKKQQHFTTNLKQLEKDEDESRLPAVIYTFFSPLTTMTAGMTHSSHDKLLYAWKKEWQARGWKTRILNIQHAKKHKHFQYFNQTIVKKFPQVSEYDRMCFFRWLAMSVVGGGFMADYDTFPLEFDSNEYFDGNLPNNGNFTSFDGFVPALVSGIGEEWDRMALELLEAIQNQNFTDFVSDMFALKFITEMKPSSFVSEVVKKNRNDIFNGIFYKSVGMVDCKRMNEKKAIHFSHYATAETTKSNLLSEFNKSDVGGALENRWKVATDFIRTWKAQCKKVVTTID